MTTPKHGADATAASPGHVTEQLTGFILNESISPPPATTALAKLSVFDWLTVTLAGTGEPVSQIVRTCAEAEGGSPQATIITSQHRKKLPARAAAMVNGTASHALDYDDTHFAYVGHPTVAIFPAALAMAERLGSSGRELLQAFIVGVEASCRLGRFFGKQHYRAGFHQTATSGAFGATAACARLLKLDAHQTRSALGLVATRASGLKSQFGTMGKPFHAGMAASNGVEAAVLAANGFIARADGIECGDGFAATHHAERCHQDDILAGLPEDFLFSEIQYKFHACCHGIHPTIEAARCLIADHKIVSSEIGEITVRINPVWLPVCCIANPQSGLEAKFSLPLVLAMLVAGIDTGAIASFSSAICSDKNLIAIAKNVRIAGAPELSDTTAEITMALRNGETPTVLFDIKHPSPLNEISLRLREKSQSLLGPQLSKKLWDLSQHIEQLERHTISAHLHSAIEHS